MDRNTDRPRLVRDRPGDRLTDPPGSIGAEFESLTVIELLDSLNKPQVPLLDQIQKQHTASHIALRDTDYKTKVSLCQTLLGILIPLCHPARQIHFLICRQKRNLADLLQIHTHRIFDADSVGNRQIQLLHIYIVFL